MVGRFCEAFRPVLESQCCFIALADSIGKRKLKVCILQLCSSVHQQELDFPPWKILERPKRAYQVSDFKSATKIIKGHELYKCRTESYIIISEAKAWCFSQSTDLQASARKASLFHILVEFIGHKLSAINELFLSIQILKVLLWNVSFGKALCLYYGINMRRIFNF